MIVNGRTEGTGYSGTICTGPWVRGSVGGVDMNEGEWGQERNNTNIRKEKGEREREEKKKGSEFCNDIVSRNRPVQSVRRLSPLLPSTAVLCCAVLYCTALHAPSTFSFKGKIGKGKEEGGVPVGVYCCSFGLCWSSDQQILTR